MSPSLYSLSYFLSVFFPFCFLRPTIVQRLVCCVGRWALRVRNSIGSHADGRLQNLEFELRKEERISRRLNLNLNSSSNFQLLYCPLLCSFQPFLLIVNVCDYKPEQCVTTQNKTESVSQNFLCTYNHT